MKITEIKIKDLKPAEYNPREKTEHTLKSVRESLREHDWLQPIVVNTHSCERCGDRNMTIVGGHRRIEAAIAEGREEAPAVFVDLHIEDEKVVNLRLNAQEPFNRKGLAELITELHNRDTQRAATLGFSQDEITRLLFDQNYSMADKLTGVLKNRFLVPPFSVFDSKQGYWQDRKKQWKELLGNLSETRETTLAGGSSNPFMCVINQGTSVFDPVVSEIIYSWFLPKGGKILDPFAGSLARGGVAAALGYDYTGVEIRKEQIEANEKQLEGIGLKTRYIHADANDINKHLGNEKFDLVFTSPPYFDLEIYSEQKEDISTQKTYEQFMEEYASIFEQATSRLNDNRFVVLELGEIRDKRGMYRNFLGDNISLFKRMGFELYNEIVHVLMLATAPLRAEHNMRNRKVVKTHQNIYTFYKGDPKLLENPQLLETHRKVLTFFKGDPEEIRGLYPNPPQIQRDISRVIDFEDDENL